MDAVKKQKNKVSASLIDRLKKPFRFRLYLLFNLPLAFLAGLRVERFDEELAEVSIPYNFITKNPFKSVYFAALAMAAELASGLQAMHAVQQAPTKVSMLVLAMKAEFGKKARSRIYFQSNAGKQIAETVQQCLQTNKGETITVSSSGFDKSGQEVATFWFTWTFKQKQ